MKLRSKCPFSVSLPRHLFLGALCLLRKRSLLDDVLVFFRHVPSILPLHNEPFRDPPPHQMRPFRQCWVLLDFVCLVFATLCSGEGAHRAMLFRYRVLLPRIEGFGCVCSFVGLGSCLVFSWMQQLLSFCWLRYLWRCRCVLAFDNMSSNKICGFSDSQC